jgi:hypothetical protein
MFTIGGVKDDMKEYSDQLVTPIIILCWYVALALGYY